MATTTVMCLMEKHSPTPELFGNALWPGPFSTPPKNPSAKLNKIFYHRLQI